MARYDSLDHAGHTGTTSERDVHSLRGHRPDGGFAAHRTPGECNDPQALPDVRTPSDRPGGRRDGHDRRPQRQIAGAQPARRKDPPPQPGGDQETARQAARFRIGRSQRGDAGEQLRLDEGNHLPGFHPRHRQADYRELHDGQRFGKETLQRRRRRDVVHRIHLPARAGLRLPAPVRNRRLQIAARRRRPVGQHHHRHGADPPQGRRRGFRPHLPADYQSRRHQVRQDRERQRMARPALYVALQVLPVLAQHQRRGRQALHQDLHVAR